MALGMSLATFTLLHVIISLIAIATGLITIIGLLTSNPMRGWTALFLVMTILTSVTGFFFPFEKLLPSHHRNFFAHTFDDCLFRAVCGKAFRRLAMDLHFDRDGFAVSQRVRSGHSKFPEDRPAACAGAERAAKRATIRYRSGHCAGFIRHRDRCGREKIPACTS